MPSPSYIAEKLKPFAFDHMQKNGEYTAISLPLSSHKYTPPIALYNIAEALQKLDVFIFAARSDTAANTHSHLPL